MKSTSVVVVVVVATVFVQCLLVAHVSGGVTTRNRREEAKQFSIATGPSNQAVIAGESTVVTLVCRVSPESIETARIQWFEYSTVPTGNQISDTNLLLPGHPHFLRYSLNTTSPGQYDLHISSVSVEDGAYYSCDDFNASPPYQTELGAQLVVIEDEPRCATSLPDGIVLEGSNYVAECVMHFRSGYGVEPLITFSGPEPFLRLNAVSNKTVYAGASFTVSRDMQSMVYSSLFNFTRKGFESPNSATNIPDWTYTWQTPKIDVRWGPKNLYISPDLSEYEVGSVVTCFADALPQALIYWQNIDTSEIWFSESIVIRADLVGSNNMRCHAQNIINDVVYFNDFFTVFNVKPVATTPIHGSTTVMTTPAPESYCNDLSGRWQSYNPRATLCMWIDNSANGVVSGLFRNETDTYWHDIYGRAQVNTFDQGGFTTVGPGKLGVTSFVLECKACYGVETMTVSPLLRSSSSANANECGNAGVKNILPDYKFYRVDNAPPCVY